MKREHKNVPKREQFFTQIATKTACAAARSTTFAVAVAVIVVWGVSGALFHFSDTWQLVINTGTTIVTFLMVFLIQNSQNRESETIQIKLDELIRVTKGHNVLLDLDELTPEELEKVKSHYVHLAEKARDRLKAGKRDTDAP